MKTDNKTLKNEVGVTPEEYSRIDCGISEDDFDTEHPNPIRIDRTISEIKRYLRYKGGRRL